MQIVKAPASILTKKAEQVTKFDRKLKTLVSKMTDTLKVARNPEGVGLAAPQVGVSKKVFVMQLNPENPDANPRYLACVNPEIIKTLKHKNTKTNLPNLSNTPNSATSPMQPTQPTQPTSLLEGCLSINNTWGYPERAQKIKLRYQDTTGKKHTKILSGFPAVIAQHEIDHLNGILFTHRVLQQNKDLYRMEKDLKTKESILVPLDL